MQKYIIVFLLFLLPLIFFPFGTSPFEIPKIIFAEIGIELMLFFFIYKKENINLDKKIIIPVVLIASLSIIHLLFLKTETTFFGNVFRLQGVFLLWHLLLFSILSTKIKITDIPKGFYFLSFGIIFILAFILGTNENHRLYSTLGEPNSLAATVVFLWPILYFSNVKKLKKIIPVKFIFPILALILIFFSGSRSGLIAIGIQFAFLFFNNILRISFVKSALICVSFILISLALPLIEGGGIFENRSEVWQTAVIAGLKNPIFGSGFGNVEQTLYKTSNIILHNNVQYQYVDSSHNFILDWWVEGGIAGILLILFLITRAFKDFILESKKLELIVFLGIITTMLFNPVSIVVLIYFWWLIGQSLSSKKCFTIPKKKSLN